MWGSSFALYKQIWRSNLLGSLLQPLLYLLGMGLGVGSLVDRGTSSDDILGGVDYVAFLAPALLATTAMIVVAQEALWPVMDGFTWSYAYRAMAATPLRSGRHRRRRRPVARHPRVSPPAGGVAVVLALFPATRSWGLLAGRPVRRADRHGRRRRRSWRGRRRARTASSRSRRSCASASSRCSCSPAPSTRSTELPGWLQPVAQVTPLYHGVELCRGAVLHTLGGVDAAGPRRRARRLLRRRDRSDAAAASPGGWPT